MFFSSQQYSMVFFPVQTKNIDLQHYLLQQWTILFYPYTQIVYPPSVFGRLHMMLFINKASFHFSHASFYMYTHKDAYTSLHNRLILSLGKIPSSGIARLKGMCILTFVTFLPKRPPKRLNICTFLLILHLSFCALCLQESRFCSRLCLTSEMGMRIQQTTVTFIKHILTARLCSDTCEI